MDNLESKVKHASVASGDKATYEAKPSNGYNGLKLIEEASFGTGTSIRYWM